MKYKYFITVLFCFLTLRLAAQVTITTVSSCTGYTLTATETGMIPTDIGVYSDDGYSQAMNIGFTFNFYGRNDTQCVIGENGMVTFNIGQASSYDPWQIGAPLLNNNYAFDAICGVWCDLVGNIGPRTPIYKSMQGTAPNRTFAVTWCGVPLINGYASPYTNCGSWETSQIILYETSNIVEVHIGNYSDCPQIPPWNGGYAITGVQNASGTAATAAPGEDYPAVWNATDIAWRFTPNNTFTAYSVASIPYNPIPYQGSIYWYNATTGAYLGTGDSLIVTDTVTTTYEAAVLGCHDTSKSYITLLPIDSMSGVSGWPKIDSISSTDPSVCGFCDGTITLHGGIIPGISDTVNFLLNNVVQPSIVYATSGPDSSLTITGLCAGSYSNFTVKQTCTSLPAGPVILTNPPIAISHITNTGPSICNVCDATITLYGLYPGATDTIRYDFGGVPQPYVVASVTATGTVTLTRLCAGTYADFTATMNSCTSPPTDTFTIPQPPPITVNIVSSANPTECGKCDGQIVIAGVTPYMVDSAFYTFIAPNGASVNAGPAIVATAGNGTATLSGLCEGAYYDFYLKQGPCPTATITSTVTLVAPAMSASFDTTIHLGCNGDTIHFINTSTPPSELTYAWQFGDNTSDTSTNPIHIYAQGIYTPTLTATNGYCVQTATTTIKLVHPLQTSFASNKSIVCQGTPVVFTNGSTGTPPLYYAWYLGDGDTSTAVSITHTYSNTGTYNVWLVATNFIPCSDTAYKTIYVDSNTVISMLLTDTAICGGTTVTFNGIYTSIGNTGMKWNFGDGDSMININPVTYAYGTEGNFKVTLTSTYRVCPTATISHNVSVFPTPVIDLGNDTSICAGSGSITLVDNINRSNPLATWLWNTGQTTPGIIVTTPGAYAATVYIKGCNATDSVIVQNNCFLNIPNVFTPNGDGVNDYFCPQQSLSKGAARFKMDIYNRWGTLVFEGTNINGKGWDGKLNNTDQPEGVYVYVIDVAFVDGGKEHRQGNVTLLR